MTPDNLKSLQVAIPANWQFTADQLTPIIARRNPGAVLAGVRVLEGSDGTSSRARLALDYAQGSGPASVFVKTQGDIWHRLLHFMTGNLYHEARLYGSGEALPLEHPAPYFGMADPLRLNELVIMEDLSLRGVTLNDATKSVPLDAVAEGLRGLARLHATYWNFTKVDHPRLAWVRPWRATLRFRAILRGATRKGLVNMRESLPQTIIDMGASGLESHWTRYIRTVAKGPATLLHGDPHIGNTYSLPDGRFGFLDWACVRSGNWGFDTGYFLVSALDVEDRRACERDLLEIYRQALELPQADMPSRDEVWLRYRASPAYGLAVWIATASSAEYQNHAICSTLIRRFATAFIDLDTPAAIAGHAQ